MASIQQIARQISSVRHKRGQATLVLTLAVRYDRHGVPADELTGNLGALLQKAVEKEWLTGAGPAEVDSWSFNIIEL